MKKTLIASLIIASLWSCETKESFFEPIANTDLRLPSVPLIVSDPYLSIWSPFDKLTDGTTRHWTDDKKPLNGMLRVDGVTYRFMGNNQEYMLSPLAPMAHESTWEAEFTQATPEKGWQNTDFDAKQWEKKAAAFGSRNTECTRTKWSDENSDIYLRRTIDLNDEDLASDLYLIYSHDDVFELYVNGTEIVNTGNTWVDNVTLHLDGEKKALFHEGKNVIAAHCHNTIGGAYADFGLYKNTLPKNNVKLAEQKNVNVLATNTYYTFSCGPVELDVVFTAPMLMDDYDLLSMPINYISTQVRSTDGAKHDVQLYLGASALCAVNNEYQPTESTFVSEHGMNAVRTGTIEQPILAKKGDHICIDWGYFYLPSVNGEVGIGTCAEMENAFIQTGKIPELNSDTANNQPEGQKKYIARKASEQPTLSYVHDFGKTEKANSFAMMGYDEIDDIEYMYHRYKGYWAHEGKVNIMQAFKNMQNRYESIMKDCRKLDKRIYDDGMAVGGKQYAEILSGSYRHVIAAHKLFRDKEGNLMFFSKENNSNGCVNTVDLTYPEAPLFLLYNPELQKAMMTSILEYSYTGRWTKPFAAHDLGTYPIANGQVYGGDMPLEEAGNIITLATTLCILDGNTKFVDKYWDVLTTWANYLSENGQDPEEQLCTDDFAGHWAHNCNLSLKAICGVAGYGLMAGQRGDKATSEKFLKRAHEMAEKWEEMASDGDHYRLAFDRDSTWSQKYNMVWDKLWNTKLFKDEVFEKEIAYYLTVQNKYGLPLDCRKDYTKSDWIMWTAAMSPDQPTFEKFVKPLYDYVNETPSRVPISDWSDTKNARMIAFKARSVIGGYWMRVLEKKFKSETKQE